MRGIFPIMCWEKNLTLKQQQQKIQVLLIFVGGKIMVETRTDEQMIQDLALRFKSGSNFLQTIQYPNPDNEQGFVKQVITMGLVYISN